MLHVISFFLFFYFLFYCNAACTYDKEYAFSDNVQVLVCQCCDQLEKSNELELVSLFLLLLLKIAYKDILLWNQVISTKPANSLPVIRSAIRQQQQPKM